jgi:hypothetical protein
MLEQMIGQVHATALGREARQRAKSAADQSRRHRENQPISGGPTDYETWNEKTQLIPAHKGIPPNGPYANGVRNRE